MKFEKNAVTVSWVLIGILIILAVGIGFGFTYASSFLKDQALVTNHAKIDNELAEQDITKLRTLSAYLKANESLVTRASDIVAESQAYTYQDQGIADINTYANRTGVGIIGIDFPDVTKQSQKQKTAIAIPGVKRVPIIVRMSPQVRYPDFIRFIKSIEQNLTKMQITSVTMTPDPKSPGTLMAPTINIEVFIR